MGFFSWLTADTRESISNIHSERPVKTVYLLQPDGQSPLEEPAYNGYGVFAGVSAYAWLARANLSTIGVDPKGVENDWLEKIGIQLQHGVVCRDTQTGDIWAIFDDVHPWIPQAKFSPYSWAAPLPEYDGASANALVESGRFEKVPVRSIVPIHYPLKFSFNPDASYEDLPASKECPHQGFFYFL